VWPSAALSSTRRQPHPAIYAAVGIPSTRVREHTRTMLRRMLCMVGIHRWVELRNDDGEPYTECAGCGKYNVTPQQGGTLPPIA